MENKDLGADPAFVATRSNPQAVSTKGFNPGDRLTQAIALACEFHAGQVDKGGQPYILHPLRVMLKMEGEDRRIVAVLHDTVEDCGLELGLIKKRFGTTIADAVDALTRRDGESYDDFIERCGVNDLARSVKWADISDNSDLSRLSKITAADIVRTEKYRKAADRLTELAIAAGTRRAETTGSVGAADARAAIAQNAGHKG